MLDSVAQAKHDEESDDSLFAEEKKGRVVFQGGKAKIQFS